MNLGSGRGAGGRRHRDSQQSADLLAPHSPPSPDGLQAMLSSLQLQSYYPHFMLPMSPVSPPDSPLFYSAMAAPLSPYGSPYAAQQQQLFAQLHHSPSLSPVSSPSSASSASSSSGAVLELLPTLAASGLPSSMSEADVWQLFGQYGSVVAVAMGSETLLEPQQPGGAQQSVRDVVVQMQSDWEAQAAAQQLNAPPVKAADGAQYSLQVRLLT
jgi:hypothetical protein